MNQQTIEVFVAPDGQTKVETKGFSGSRCRDASQFIEEALGQRTGEQLTLEFHWEGTTAAVQQPQGGP